MKTPLEFLLLTHALISASSVTPLVLYLFDNFSVFVHQDKLSLAHINSPKLEVTPNYNVSKFKCLGTSLWPLEFLTTCIIALKVEELFFSTPPGAREVKYQLKINLKGKINFAGAKGPYRFLIRSQEPIRESL
jgi:hypothetical protein